MIAAHLAPQFTRQFRKLETDLQEEALEKMGLFKDPKNHPALHVHKLHGPLTGRWSFSVNYRWRIVFSYENTQKTVAVFLAIGDHDLYR